MNSTNTGGPAFPVPDIDGSAVCEGMTLRDYFAAKVLPSYLADQTLKNVTQGEIARLAYDMADSMLDAREA